MKQPTVIERMTKHAATGFGTVFTIGSLVMTLQDKPSPYNASFDAYKATRAAYVRLNQASPIPASAVPLVREVGPYGEARYVQAAEGAANAIPPSSESRWEFNDGAAPRYLNARQREAVSDSLCAQVRLFENMDPIQ